MDVDIPLLQVYLTLECNSMISTGGWSWLHALLAVQNPIYFCLTFYNFNLIHSLERPLDPVLLLSDLRNPVNPIRMLKCSSESPSVITTRSQS